MMNHPALKGRVAAVTGGSGVLGRTMALALGRQGVKVAILNRTEATGQAVADEIRAEGGEALAVRCDVLDQNSVEAANARIVKTWGPVEILINGAGGNHPQASTEDETLNPAKLRDSSAETFYRMAMEGFRTVMDLNLVGAVIPSQVFSRGMAEQSRGTIVNISSMSAPRPMTRVPAYSAAKAGVENFTKWLAVYLAEAGVRVNALAPGFFITDQNRRLLLAEDGTLTPRSEKILAHTPMKRFGVPEDLVGTLLWLVDDAYSGFVTGITVPVDGGFLAYAGV